jgi:hypothetical protein
MVILCPDPTETERIKRRRFQSKERSIYITKQKLLLKYMTMKSKILKMNNTVADALKQLRESTLDKE